MSSVTQVSQPQSEQITPRSKSRIKLIVRRLLIILFGLTIGWLLIEVLLRVSFDVLPPGIQSDIQHVRQVPWSDSTIIPAMPFVIDRDFQARIPPDLHNYLVHWSDAQFTFSTIPAWHNPDGSPHRAGLRSDPPNWPLDILTFGDSFTFCWTKYEDCWAHHLQADYSWHIFNAGIPGTGTTGQLNLMKEIAPPLSWKVNPPVVIWQWFSNDVTDDYDLARLRGETPELQGGIYPDPVPEPTGLARYSALYALFAAKFTQSKPSQYQHYQLVTLNGRPVSVHTNEYPFSASIIYPADAYGWAHNVQSHKDGAQLLKDIGAKMIIIPIPTKEEAYADQLVNLLGQKYLDQMGETRRLVLEQCTKEGWYCIDPLPAFQQAIKNGQTIYYAFDAHLDASGNKVLAELVHDYIIKNGLLSGK